MKKGTLVEIIYPDKGRLAIVLGPAPKVSRYQSWSEVLIRELDTGNEYHKETDCLEIISEFTDNITLLLYT